MLTSTDNMEISRGKAAMQKKSGQKRNEHKQQKRTPSRQQVAVIC